MLPRDALLGLLLLLVLFVLLDFGWHLQTQRRVQNTATHADDRVGIRPIASL